MGNVAEAVAGFRNRKPLVLALLLPGIPYLVLCLLMPAQYKFVASDAAARGAPLFWVGLTLLVYFAIVLLMLAAVGAFSRGFVIIAGIPVAAASLSTAIAAGLTVSTGSLLFLMMGIPAAAAIWLPGQRIPTSLSAPQSVWIALGVGLLLYLAVGGASILEPLTFPRAIGSLTILAVTLGAFGLCAAAMALKPRFAACVALYCVFALFFFSENDHRIPITTAKAPSQPLDESFAAWLSSRRDLDVFKANKMPYPVIFISSEGGGIYAAAHAYVTLSAIARHCPTFSQHVFAAVGVSGGAIGNALFAAAADPEQKSFQPCGSGGSATSANPIVTDHLSPVLARLLLVEAVDRLVPGQWVRRDRAQVLTDSFLAAMGGKAYGQAALTDSFDPTGARPALIAVATDRDSGNRVIMSPFRPGRATAAEWWPASFSDDAVSEQISVINAAGLSARFPWVTPTGRLQTSKTEERVLADGGYFDNSGAETISDLIDALRFDENLERFFDGVDARLDPADRPVRNACDRIRTRIIRNFHLGDNDDGKGVTWGTCEIPIFPIYFALASDDAPPTSDTPRADLGGPPHQYFLNDPLTVLLQTRRSRGNNALNYADLENCGQRLGISGAECAARPGSSPAMFRNDVYPEAWRLPLGWFMGEDSFNAIMHGTAKARYFTTRARRNPAESETELMLYHLDPWLYRGSEESVGPLWTNFAD